MNIAAFVIYRFTTPCLAKVLSRWRQSLSTFWTRAGDLNTSEYVVNWFTYSFVFEREKTYEHGLNISWMVI